MLPLNPMRNNFIKSKSWETESNAFFRSRKIHTTYNLLLLFCFMLKLLFKKVITFYLIILNIVTLLIIIAIKYILKKNLCKSIKAVSLCFTTDLHSLCKNFHSLFIYFISKYLDIQNYNFNIWQLGKIIWIIVVNSVLSS